MDNDPDATATYALNFPSRRWYHRRFACACDPRAGVGGGSVSLGAGGWAAVPGVSQVRNHARMIDDARNALYREFVHVLGETRPMAFVMENVTGIDQMGVRSQIAADLALDGEYLVVPQVVDAR